MERVLEESHFFSTVAERDEYRVSLVKALQTVESPGDVRSLMRRLRPFRTPNEATAVMTALTRTVSPEAGLEVFEEVEIKNAALYSCAIAACGKAGLAARAMNLLTEMQTKGFAPHVYAFSSAMAALAKKGLWEDARALLVEMRRRRLEPNVVCYGAALSACARGGAWREARNLLVTMRQRGVEPNDIAYKAVLHVTEQQGAWEALLATCDEMAAQDKKGARSSSQQQTSNSRDYVPYAQVATRRQKTWGEKLTLFDNRTIDKALLAAKMANKPERVVDFFFNARPNLKRNFMAVHYEMCITSLGKLGRVDEALSLAETMRETVRRPVSLETHRSLLQSSKEADLALNLLADMRTKDNVEPDVDAFADAIGACDRAANPDRALDVLAEAKQRLKQEDKDHIRSLEKQVVALCHRHGAWRTVLSLYDDAFAAKDRGTTTTTDGPTAGPDPDTIALAILSAEYGGQWTTADNILREARLRWSITPPRPSMTASRFKISFLPHVDTLDPAYSAAARSRRSIFSPIPKKKDREKTLF